MILKGLRNCSKKDTAEGNASLLPFYYLIYLFVYIKKFELEISFYIVLTYDLTLLDAKEISELIG